ncbi:MAG TPA: biotin--[acetyl-CoA-carboxylase] ligase [Marmoricola sp.]
MTGSVPARSPLDPVAAALAAGDAWSLTLLPTAGSTNEIAAATPVPGRVVVADHQVSGRGRLDRSWVTPPGTALTFSAVVDPGIPDDRWPLIPLAAGVAVATAIHGCGGAASVKWPNDVLLPDDGAGADHTFGRKVCGILAERVGSDPAVAVIGIGINVDLREEELPVPTASSLAIAGLDVARVDLLGAVLKALSAQLDALRADPTGFLVGFREMCSTIGRSVAVLMPDGSRIEGTAVGIDGAGCLEVEAGGEVHRVAAGDVVHVRPVT